MVTWLKNNAVTVVFTVCALAVNYGNTQAELSHQRAALAETKAEVKVLDNRTADLKVQIAVLVERIDALIETLKRK